MREFIIGPADEPDWAIDVSAFLSGMLARWPQGRVHEYADQGPQTHEVNVAFPDGEALSVWIMPPQAIHAETFDVRKLGEFIEWWVSHAPGFDPDLRIYDTTDFERSLPLSASTTAADVVRIFA